MGKRRKGMNDHQQPPAKKPREEGSITDRFVDKETIDEMVKAPGFSFRDMLRVPNIEAHEPSVAELEELDHMASKLVYQIDQLVTKYQWLQGVDIGSLVDKAGAENKMLNPLVKRYRIRLASLLVKQYWNEGIPVFDSILSSKYKMSTDFLSQVPASKLTMERLDELQNMVLESVTQSIRSMKQKIEGDDAFFKQTTEGVKQLEKVTEDKGAKNKAAIEKPQKIRDTWPPPLPQINNGELLTQVFTHKSTITDAALKTRSALLHIHNERLEFKGDSILDFVICEALYDEFPNDSEGSLSMKKASLVCNDTLFDLSVVYKLHKRLQVSTDLHGKIYRSPKDEDPDPVVKNKAIADVFEAYIAGAAIDKGMLVVRSWLRDLYSPLIHDLQSDNGGNDADEVNKNAKNELYRQMGSADQAITYKTLNNESPFTVCCLVGGKELGRGTDRTVKLAGLRAAEEVLKKPELVEEFAAKRRETPKTAPSTGP